MRHAAARRRVDRLHAVKSPPPPVPHVVTVDTMAGETTADAKAKFAAKFAGRFRRGHRVLVLPRRVRDEDREAFEQGFHEQQTRLVAEARASRPKEGNDNDHTRLYARQHSGSDTVRSRLATAHTARKADWKPRQLRQ